MTVSIESTIRMVSESQDATSWRTFVCGCGSRHFNVLLSYRGRVIIECPACGDSRSIGEGF